MKLSVYASQSHLRFTIEEFAHIGIQSDREDKTKVYYVKLKGSFTEELRIFKSSAEEQALPMIDNEKVYKVLYPRDMPASAAGHVAISKNSNILKNLKFGAKEVGVKFLTSPTGINYVKAQIFVKSETAAIEPLTTVVDVKEPQLDLKEPNPLSDIADAVINIAKTESVAVPDVQTHFIAPIIAPTVVEKPVQQVTTQTTVDNSKINELKDLSVDLNKMLSIHPSLFVAYVNGKLVLEQEVEYFEVF